MKHSLILIAFLIWSISGCSFLGFHSDPYGLEDNEEVEESATAEEGTYEEDEEEDGEEMEDEEEGGEKRGFFARMFSFGDDDEEDMDEMEDEEEDAEDYEDEGEEQAEEEETDDDQMYAEMESYDEENSQEDGDMESYDDGSDEGPAMADANTGSDYENLPSPAKTVTKLISVKKIKTSPYRRSGFLVNAVYLARQGDTIESVSQKIYGQDRSGDLYSINPHFRSRPLKTGAKVYYPSPQRPNDSSQLLVYYEDIGLPPNYHSLERGQNIRTAARNLLGSPDSWKEIWATNPEIQSKGAAEQTMQLRYWDGSGTPPPPPEPQEVAQAPEETFPEEPPQQMPEPSQDMGAAPIESPPPMEENFGDPLPDDSSQPSKMGIVETIKKNKLLAIGLIAFIALLLLLIKKIIHKMRDSEDEFDYTKTSIDNNKISI